MPKALTGEVGPGSEHASQLELLKLLLVASQSGLLFLSERQSPGPGMQGMRLHAHLDHEIHKQRSPRKLVMSESFHHKRRFLIVLNGPCGSMAAIMNVILWSPHAFPSLNK